MHDIARLMKDLNDTLSQDKRHLGVLIGAGCPAAVRVSDGASGTKALIPDVAGLTRLVADRLGTEAPFAALKKQFSEDGLVNPNVEQMLTHVRTLSRIVGTGEARGLDRDALASLEETICKVVHEATGAALPGRETAYHKFCRWIRDIERTVPVSLFTTNYDLLLEQALEDEEVPYFDGFAGARRPFLDLRSMEIDVLPPRWARLWKLHGSINWRLEPSSGTVVRRIDGGTCGGLLIHPSELKYDQSRRMPYLAMFDRLRAFLRTPGAVLLTCGYSYADDHLNETIVQGLTGNMNATAFGLLFRNWADEPSAMRLVARVPANLCLLARDKALIRRRIEEWSEAGTTAEFQLGDFAAFAEFASSLGGTRPTTAVMAV